MKKLFLHEETYEPYSAKMKSLGVIKSSSPVNHTIDTSSSRVADSAHANVHVAVYEHERHIIALELMGIGSPQEAAFLIMVGLFGIATLIAVILQSVEAVLEDGRNTMNSDASSCPSNS